jgi:ABC-type polar amino acid transport system ATPase subunit
LIKLNGIQKWFGDLHVLSNINLHIHKDEVVVILGPSGSGKSTLIKCINGLEQVQAGEIIIDGIQLNYRKKKN